MAEREQPRIAPSSSCPPPQLDFIPLCHHHENLVLSLKLANEMILSCDSVEDRGVCEMSVILAYSVVLSRQADFSSVGAESRFFLSLSMKSSFPSLVGVPLVDLFLQLELIYLISSSPFQRESDWSANTHQNTLVSQTLLSPNLFVLSKHTSANRHHGLVRWL